MLVALDPVRGLDRSPVCMVEAGSYVEAGHAYT
jgi:hypothetical protein